MEPELEYSLLLYFLFFPQLQVRGRNSIIDVYLNFTHECTFSSVCDVCAVVVKVYMYCTYAVIYFILPFPRSLVRQNEFIHRGHEGLARLAGDDVDELQIRSDMEVFITVELQYTVAMPTHSYSLVESVAHEELC